MIYDEVWIDTNKFESGYAIAARRNEEIAQVKVIVTNNGEKINNSQFSLKFMGNNAKGDLTSGEAVRINGEEGAYNYTFTPENLAVPGQFKTAYFELYNSAGKKITSSNIQFRVIDEADMSADQATIHITILEKMVKEHENYIEKGKENWEGFVDQNKEIIESVDPGGTLLARIGMFDDFRKWDKEVITKMANEFTERGVNVKWFGAKGDGIADDTEAIQEAVDFVHEKGGGKVRLLDGTYLIDVTPRTQPNIYVREEKSGITLYNNVELIMTDNAILKAKETASKAYNILRVYNCKNVKISGGQIIGDVDEHGDTGGEWGYGIAVSGGENITIENVTITKCWGDGINLQVYQPDIDDYENVVPPNYVYIRNVTCKDNRRQGMSVEGGHNISISGSNFNDTGKTKFTKPGSGIDIEPWRAQARDFYFVDQVLIKDCVLSNNKATGITVMNPVVKNVVVDSCDFVNNADSEAQFKTYNGARDILIKNCTIKSNVYETSKAGLLLSNGSNLRANGNHLTNCHIHVRNFDNLESDMKDVYVENNSVKIEKNFKTVWIVAVTNSIENVHIKNNLIEFEGDISSSNELPTVWLSNTGYCNFEKNTVSNLGIGITINNSNTNVDENQIINTSQYAIKVNGNLNNISVARNKISGACRFLREIGAIYVNSPESIVITNNVIYRKSIVPISGELKSTGCRVADINFKSNSSPSVFFSDNTMIEDFTSYNQPVKLTGLETVSDRSKICIFSNNQTGWGNTTNIPKTAMLGDLFFDTTQNRLLVCSSSSAYYANGEERLKAVWRDMNGNIVN